MLANKKEADFFEMLNAQAQSAYDAADTFHAFAIDFSQRARCLKKLEDIEHQGDTITYEFVNFVNTQIHIPLDKEDMFSLTDRLDNITDTIEKAASRIDVYRIASPRPELKGLVTMLVGITKETQLLVQQLRGGFRQADLKPIIAGIHAMETRSDKAFRLALTGLFDDENLDVRQLIQWKEVYELIEKAINRCEKLAGFIETLIVKYA